MIQIILYDNWMETAHKKVRVNGKEKQVMGRTQIKALLRLCSTAERTEFLSIGTLYQIK